MRIHSFQHVHYEGLGNIADWIAARRHQLSITRFFQNDPLPQIADVDLLIIMGGPMGAYEENIYPWLAAEKKFIREAIEAGKKVLGICLGAQLIASVLGSDVYPDIHREIGWFPLSLTDEGMESKVFAELPVELTAFHWHADTFTFPAGAVRLAQSAACRNQAFLYGDKVVGLQFHLDVKKEDVVRWVKQGGALLTPEQYVQSAEEIISRVNDFETMEKHMHSILHYLEKLS